MGFPSGSAEKNQESTCNAGNTEHAGSIPGLGRSPRGEHGNPLQFVLAWRIAWTRGTWQATVHRVAESWTRLKWLSMHTRIYVYIGLPGGLVVKNPPTKCWRNKRHGFDPWIGKIPWNRKWQPTAVFLPGEFHGQRSLAGYSSWSCKESDTSEWLSTHIYVCMCM